MTLGSFTDLHCLLSRRNSLIYGCNNSFKIVFFGWLLSMPRSFMYCSSSSRTNSLCTGCSQSNRRAIAGPWEWELTNKWRKASGISLNATGEPERIPEQTIESSASLAALWVKFHLVKWLTAKRGPEKPSSPMCLDCPEPTDDLSHFCWSFAISGIKKFSDEVSNSVFSNESSAMKKLLLGSLLHKDLFDSCWVTKELFSPLAHCDELTEDLMQSAISSTVPDWSFQIPLTDQNPMELTKWEHFQTWTFCPFKSSSAHISAPQPTS